MKEKHMQIKVNKTVWDCKKDKKKKNTAKRK